MQSTPGNAANPPPPLPHRHTKHYTQNKYRHTAEFCKQHFKSDDELH